MSALPEEEQIQDDGGKYNLKKRTANMEVKYDLVFLAMSQKIYHL